MSCGRNRRRLKLSSTLNSRLYTHPETSSAKIHLLSHGKKSNPSEPSSKQTSREITNEFDRFRILDDKGNDVTPRLITDYVRIKLKSRREDEKSTTEITNKRIIENIEPSVSERSIIGTINLSTSTSQMLHTGTLFSAGDKATLDIGTRLILESEQLLNKTLSDRASRANSENQESQAKFLPGLGLQSIDLSTDNVILNETDTMFILDLESNVVSQEDHDEYDRIKENNKIYIELCKNRQENDLYIERGMQTFNDLPKHEHIITDPVLTRSQQSWATTWDIHDSVIEANQYEGTIYRQYTTHNNENLNDDRVKHDSYNNIDKKMLPNESSSQNSSTFFSHESLVKITPSKTNCFELNDDNKNKLPEIDIDALIMERILNSNTYLYQGNTNRKGIYLLPDKIWWIKCTVSDSDIQSPNKRDSSPIKYSNVNLESLWNYSSHLTKNRNVSCLCWSQHNHDLLAVGYGKFQYNNDREGLVCCWNAKNPQFPERYYQTDAGVTSLAFSHQRSNLLAVGLFNGNIYIFDLNQNNTSPIADTNDYHKKHTNPVWQIAWNEPDRSSKLGNIQILLSISSDGRITQWILRKEFEAIDLMCLKPYNSSKTVCQALKSNDGTYTNGHFSNFVGGLCFDIRPNDKTIYLCGTDDGVIHRCSTISNEKYFESYIGHTGPVYKVHWSPFHENIFLSASADWTVRLWMIGYHQSCMVFSSANSKMFFDAIWSPKSATMFFCVSENKIEIWDLSKSTLEPIRIATCSDQITLTSIAYATDSDCILVGTNDGTVLVYHLDNLSSFADANDLNTIVEQSLFSSISSHEVTDKHTDISLTQTQTTLTNDDQH